jgi:hypothetical protein
MGIKNRFWTENEAAELCGVPYWKLKYLRDTGRISPLKVGRTLAYTETEVKIAKLLIGEREDRYQRTNGEDNQRGNQGRSCE